MSIVTAHHPLTASVSIAVLKMTSQIKESLSEKVLLEEAHARVLACDFESPFSLPPFRRAAMDGYAIRSAAALNACKEQPVHLRVSDEIRSGQPECLNDAEVNLESAIRIFTGAPVPKGYDTVIMQETVKQLNNSNAFPGIQIDRPYPHGQHIAQKGEDVPSGMKLLFSGTMIKAKEIAVLASFGQTEVAVYRKPTIAVIPIGDELTLPGYGLDSGRIYDANSFMVGARLMELGATIIRHSPVPDCMEKIEAAISAALDSADLVVTTGGVSVGDYDYVKLAAERIGGEPLFTKVAMRPGTPTSAFQFNSKLLVCLSGNPSACFTGLELLLRPVVLKMAGRSDYRSEWLEGRLTESINKPSPYPRYARAFVYRAEKEWMVDLLNNDKSGNVAAFASANALVLIPPGGSGASIGQEVLWVTLSI